MWPIKPISDYESIIGASLVSIAIGILVACAAVFVMANCKLAWYKIESHIIDGPLINTIVIWLHAGHSNFIHSAWLHHFPSGL